jgi:hypothetical protein
VQAVPAEPAAKDVAAEEAEKGLRRVALRILRHDHILCRELSVHGGLGRLRHALCPLTQRARRIEQRQSESRTLGFRGASAGSARPTPPLSRRASTDNVGDNVGDIAGMGADLFGSFAESTCAALVIAAVSSLGADHDYSAMMFPLLISAAGAGRRRAMRMLAHDVGVRAAGGCLLRFRTIRRSRAHEDLVAARANPPSLRLCAPSLAQPLRSARLRWSSPRTPALFLDLSLPRPGIVVCLLTTFVATDLKPARVIAEIEHTLKMQLIISTVLMTPVRADRGSEGHACLSEAKDTTARNASSIRPSVHQGRRAPSPSSVADVPLSPFVRPLFSARWPTPWP